MRDDARDGLVIDQLINLLALGALPPLARLYCVLVVAGDAVVTPPGVIGM